MDSMSIEKEEKTISPQIAEYHWNDAHHRRRYSCPSSDHTIPSDEFSLLHTSSKTKYPIQMPFTFVVVGNFNIAGQLPFWV
eukprot:scaffold7475_cov174-Amphora_coffeaeformis.AAC.3